MRITKLIVVLIMLGLMMLSAAEAAKYTVTDLGTLGGGESWALGVNKHGQVVGCSIDKEGRRRAFIWDHEQGMRDLGTLGGANAIAAGINDVGEIVGYSEIPDGRWDAFLITSEGSMVDLGVLTGDVASEAAAVRDFVVGTSKSIDGTTRAFSWSVDTNMVPLAAPAAGYQTRAADVNASNVIAGSAIDASGVRRAIVWNSEGTITELGTFGGVSSSAFALNDDGLVIGQAADEGGKLLPFCWLPDLGLRRLPIPRGATEVVPNAISNSNHIAGSAIGSRNRGVVWVLSKEPAKKFDASVVVLPLLSGTVESEADSVGGSGIVAGTCKTANGERHAVVWQPVESRREKFSVALVGGAYMPISSSTRDRFDSTWWRVALSPFQKSKQVGTHFAMEGGAMRLTGLTDAKLYSVSAGVERGLKPGRFAQSYLALRAGPYWGKQENTLTGDEDTKIGLNANAAYGVIFLKNFYGELRYDYYSKFSGTDFSGVSAAIGFRLFDL